jgi:hypothetical protein
MQRPIKSRSIAALRDVPGQGVNCRCGLISVVVALDLATQATHSRHGYVSQIFSSMKNANKGWTREDEELLVKLALEGHSDRRLATILGRTVHAVQVRLQILGAKSRPQSNSEVQPTGHAPIPATAPVGTVVDHLYSAVLKRRGLRRHYKLKPKARSAIVLLLRDLLRYVEHSQGVNISPWRHPDIDYVLFSELLQYLEEQGLVDRVVCVSPIELARYGKSRSVTGTRRLRELCIHFGLHLNEEASF